MGESNSTPIVEILNEAVNKTEQRPDSRQLSVEALALLINAERLKQLETSITKEFTELKARQEKVSHLLKAIKAVNAATENDELDISKNQELQSFIAKAKEYGAEIKDGKVKYNKQERDRLIENIRITADEMNILNDMQLQTITRMTTERYESYQLARSIMKPLHDDKINKARAIGGR